MSELAVTDGAVKEHAVRSYQVHVEGLLSRATISYLGWHGCPSMGQTHLRIAVGAGELAAFLQSCSVGGVVIDRITRIRS